MSNKPAILQTLDAFLDNPKEVKNVFIRTKSYGEFQQKHLVSWFKRFRDGIAFVAEHYGMVAEQFLVAETICLRGKKLEGLAAYYIPDHDCIAITYKSLAIACQAIANGSLSSSPHFQDSWVNGLDFAFLQAVEEAHHSYYLKSGQGIVDPIPGKYRDDPVEVAAGEAVRNAARVTDIVL